MTKTDQKIISIILLLIMIIVQFSPVFAADYATGEEPTKTLTQYLIENDVDGNGDGVLSNDEWAKVKNLDLTNIDLTGIEKAVNLKKLSLRDNCNVDTVDFSKLTKLEDLFLYGVTLSDNSQGNIGKATNLKRLALSLCENYSKINYANLEELWDLYIYGCTDTATNIKFSAIPSLTCFNFTSYDEETYFDLSELDNLEVLNLGLSGNVKFPKFKNLTDILVHNSRYSGHIENVAGILDLELCESVQGTVDVDISKIKLNSKTMIMKNEHNAYDLWLLEDEIDILKGEMHYLVPTISKFELEKNDNDNIAVLEKEFIDTEEDLYYQIIKAKNVGTTNMTLKDILERTKTIKINVYDDVVLDKPDTNINTDLENSGVTAKFVENSELILKSNGELWQVNSATTAEKIDTNVKDYVAKWVYLQGSQDHEWVINLLKNDGKLKIEYRYGDAIKEVSNVKQVEDNVYLTNDGKLYETRVNYITEEINPKLIKENVKKLLGECIVLEDGTTWYQDYKEYHTTANVKFKKLADFEIKDMDYYEHMIGEDVYQLIPTVIDNDNNLWCCVDRSYYFNDSGLEKLQENFEGYKLQQQGGFYRN